MSLGVLLGVLFVALKLTHHIDWSWVWVLAPFWIELAVDALLVLAVVIGGGLCSRPARRAVRR